MEDIEREIEDKRRTLSCALGRVGALMDDFEDVVRRRFDAPSHPTAEADFSNAVRKLYPDPAPSKASSKVAVEDSVAPGDDDVRLHMSFESLCDECLSCKRCILGGTRKNVVFGEGCSDRPIVMVVGEGPGETEDNTGRPFVGKAGQFLDKWLAAISLDRKVNTYITNIVKCRPPMNRDPLPDEKSACLPFLKQQIALIQPQAILCLGKPASARRG